MDKKTLGIAVAVVAVAVAAGFFLFSKPAPVTNYRSAGTDIIAFGDSLVLGVGASEGRDFVSLMSQKIGVPVVNLGVSGDKTADGLARLGALDKYNQKMDQKGRGAWGWSKSARRSLAGATSGLQKWTPRPASL